MIVPYRTSFIAKMTKDRLRNNACTYEIKAGPDFDQVLKLIENAVVEYKMASEPHPDIRVGIVFKADIKVMQEFYFDDLGGAHDVPGFSGDHSLTGLANLPNQLRLVAEHPNVPFIAGNALRCHRR
jgi:hypothetical protein